MLHCDKDESNGWYRTRCDVKDWKSTYDHVVFSKFQKDIEYFAAASNEDELGTNFIFNTSTIFNRIYVMLTIK